MFVWTSDRSFIRQMFYFLLDPSRLCVFEREPELLVFKPGSEPTRSALDCRWFTATDGKLGSRKKDVLDGTWTCGRVRYTDSLVWKYWESWESLTSPTPICTWKKKDQRVLSSKLILTFGIQATPPCRSLTWWQASFWSLSWPSAHLLKLYSSFYPVKMQIELNPLQFCI